VVLVSLHRFDEARTLATTVLAGTPDDPTSLATLGDASLELGDVAAARTAYDRLAGLAPGAAASVRLGHLAFIVGDTATAIRDARAAVKQSDADEDAVGERAGFYRYQLADTLLATGDRSGAEKAYRDAIAHDPRSFLAHAGLGRALAADGRIEDAIRELSAAIAIVPQPDMLARRSDLYQLRDGAGDAKRSQEDRQTVLAIAQLASSAGNVYDRTLALYLANHGLEPAHAVDLATAELTMRKDVYGYDALAWALLADGRVTEADAAIQTALGVGTKDAKILYHAGMIGLALGDPARARTQLQAALTLDPSFDALQAERARAALSGL
jgi:tetratricopeptide (TPR) repeat protein